MLVAWLGCLAMSEPRFDDALEKDGALKPTTRNDTLDLTDFDPLEAKPAGVIKPRLYKPPPRKKPALPPEGSKIIDRLCRISADRSGWVLACFPADGDRKAIRPRWSLPNETLEAIENIQAKNPKLMFRVSGEMTVYRDNSFILIRRVAVIEPEAKASAQSETQPGGSHGSSPATQPVKQPTTAPSSTDLMKTLLSEKNPTPVILTRQKKKVDASRVASVAPGAKGDVIEPATARLVVDRLMTIQPTGQAQWRQATFEADNTLREPPVILLPCRLLVFAEVQPPSTRLRITGEITNYKGKRYMLLRKVVVEREMNRL